MGSSRQEYWSGRSEEHTSEVISSSSIHEKGSTEIDQDKRLINTEGKTSLNQRQLSWNLEDENKFASQRGRDSSRTEDQLVSRYQRSWCIHQDVKDVKEGAVWRAKEKSQRKR